jgi:hypothetical protein
MMPSFNIFTAEDAEIAEQKRSIKIKQASSSLLLNI